jgi:ABC-type branched-subunit amino acid transport system ATPase component
LAVDHIHDFLVVWIHDKKFVQQQCIPIWFQRRESASNVLGINRRVISFGTVVPTDAEKFEGVPTLGLAPVVIEQLSTALGELRRTTPITLLLSEQNVTFALPHADRVYVLDHGRVTWEGNPTRFASEMGVGYL